MGHPKYIDIKMWGVKSKLKFVHRGAKKHSKCIYRGVHFKSKCAKRGVEKIICSPPPSTFLNGIALTSYVVLVGAWAPVVAIVAQRSTFEAMFLAPEAQPAWAGPVLSLLHPITTVGLTCPLVIRRGPHRRRDRLSQYCQQFL